MYTNCKRYCGSLQNQQEDLREVLPLSRSLHIQPVDPCALQVRKHNRYLLADVLFCLLHGISLVTRVCELARFFSCQNINCIETHLCFPYHTSHLYGNSLHLGRTICKVKCPFIVFHQQHSLLIYSTHVGHPRLKKQQRDILRCFSSRPCDSGLFRRACELLVCFVIRS